MFRFAPYILKTLWRHRARTLLTVAGAAVALFVFCFVAAVQQGMDDLQRRQSAKRSLIVFQANRFCPATSQVPQDYSFKIDKMKNVREVTPIQVYTNNCRASLDVVVFYGLPPEKLRRVRDFEVIDGGWAEFEQHQDAALIGRSVARRRGVKIGDRFTLGELTVTAAGIFRSDDPAEENYIYTHLEFLQREGGLDRLGVVTQLEVALDDNADSGAACQQIDNMFRGGPIETNTRPKGVFQAQSLTDLSHILRMSHYLGYACVGLVLALVATTTLMSVQDRIREHAILQTVGFSPPRVFALVLSESALLGLAGGAVGVGAAMAILQLGRFSLGAEAVTIAFRPSISLATFGLFIAALSGLVAGVAPAITAARVHVVAALRQS